MTPAQRQTLEKARELLPKVTPGPWEYRDHWFDNDKREVAPTFDGPPDIGEWTALAEVGGFGDDEEAQAEANAALIALAPALAALADTLARREEVLEGALRATLNFIENTEGEIGDTLYSGDVARAALSATQPKEPRT